MNDVLHFVGTWPRCADEIGLRPFEDGRPSGEWVPASALEEPRA
jgi:hypothetical protein